jgi:hypothetical protein
LAAGSIAVTVSVVPSMMMLAVRFALPAPAPSAPTASTARAVSTSNRQLTLLRFMYLPLTW